MVHGGSALGTCRTCGRMGRDDAGPRGEPRGSIRGPWQSRIRRASRVIGCPCWSWCLAAARRASASSVWSPASCASSCSSCSSCAAGTAVLAGGLRLGKIRWAQHYPVREHRASATASRRRPCSHQLQRGAAGRRVPGDGHDHLGRHLAGGRRGGRGVAAVVHDRRGGVPGRGVPGAEHQRRSLTPAGRQRGLPGKAGTAPAGKTKGPRVLQARAAREKRRLADHRRATAGTGGKAAPGTPEVHERTKKGTSQVYRTPVTNG